jgi:hypothetical protein
MAAQVTSSRVKTRPRTWSHNLCDDQGRDRQAGVAQPEDQHDEGDVVERVAEIGDDLAQPEGEVARAADHPQVRHMGGQAAHALRDRPPRRPDHADRNEARTRIVSAIQ